MEKKINGNSPIMNHQKAFLPNFQGTTITGNNTESIDMVNWFQMERNSGTI